MLGAAYLQINGTAMAVPPKTFDMEYTAIEQVNLSEAGTELVDATRLTKRVISLSWEGIYSDFLDQIAAWAAAATVSVTYRGETFSCRARGFKSSMAFKSYLHQTSDGVWNANLTLTEI